MGRRKRRALAVAACVLALYFLHFGWFLLFGPPDWLEGVRERAPDMSSVALGSTFDRYVDEFDRPRVAKVGLTRSQAPTGTVGRVVREDLTPDGAALRQTREEEQDHLYLSISAGSPWIEQPLPGFERLKEARLLGNGDGRRILMVGTRPWWPLHGNYGRFWRALFNRELRPEVGLYIADPRSGKASYLFPGRRPVPSPDRESVAFLRSERRGFHSIHLWRPRDDGLRTVASLWEADPGSGVSFSFDWSSDSRALFVRGLGRGALGRPEGRPREVRLLYDVDGDRLVELRP